MINGNNEHTELNLVKVIASCSFECIKHTLILVANVVALLSCIANGQIVSQNVKLDCSKQENKLNMAYTTGVFAMGFTSFVWGFMLEHQGLRFVRFALK